MTEPSRPAVSLVIPSYRRGARITPTLRSALDQTEPPDEIIVVNDGGFPETAEAASQLSPSIRVVNAPHQGAPETRNTGARLARGPVLMLLDDDDLLQPHAVEVLRRTLVAFPEARAAFCDHTFTDLVTGERRSNHFHELPHYARFRDLVPERQTPDRIMLFGRNLHVALLQGNLLGQPWMVWRDVYLELGGFVSGLGSADDWDLYLRLTRQHKVAVIDRVASDHFREADRVHLTTEDGQEQKQLLVALRQVELAGRTDLPAQRRLRQKIGAHYKAFGDRMRLANPGGARRQYLLSLRWWPFDLVTAIRTLYPRL